jgi:hypothetical protein
MNLYAKGQTVTCSVVFKVGATETDPTTVQFKVKPPRSEVVTYVYGTDAELVKDDVGEYHVDVVGDIKGKWVYRFEGSGVCTAVDEAEFSIHTAFP